MFTTIEVRGENCVELMEAEWEKENSEENLIRCVYTQYKVCNIIWSEFQVVCIAPPVGPQIRNSLLLFLLQEVPTCPWVVVTNSRYCTPRRYMYAYNTNDVGDKENNARGN